MFDGITCLKVEFRANGRAEIKTTKDVVVEVAYSHDVGDVERAGFATVREIFFLMVLKGICGHIWQRNPAACLRIPLPRPLEDGSMHLDLRWTRWSGQARWYSAVSRIAVEYPDPLGTVFELRHYRREEQSFEDPRMYKLCLIYMLGTEQTALEI